MTEARLQAVKRRWQNITNAIRGVNAYVDEHGTRYADVPLTAEEADLVVTALKYYRSGSPGIAEAAFEPELSALVTRLEAQQ